MAKRDSKTKRWLAELLEEIEKINLEEEKAPKRVFFNFGMMLSIKFFLERNAKELHFAILNLYNIMICKRALYCFVENIPDVKLAIGKNCFALSAALDTT